MTLSTTTGTPNGVWQIKFDTYRNSGYTPVAYSLVYSSSLSVVVGVEQFDINAIAGFCNMQGRTVSVSLLFMKV